MGSKLLGLFSEAIVKVERPNDQNRIQEHTLFHIFPRFENCCVFLVRNAKLSWFVGSYCTAGIDLWPEPMMNSIIP